MRYHFQLNEFHPKSAAVCFFEGTQECRNSRGKQAFSVRAEKAKQILSLAFL